MANNLRDQLDQAAREQNAPKNLSGNGRKKKPSGFGIGKWETCSSLARYRTARNKARKLAKKQRAANR